MILYVSQSRSEKAPYINIIDLNNVVDKLGGLNKKEWNVMIEVIDKFKGKHRESTPIPKYYKLIKQGYRYEDILKLSIKEQDEAIRKFNEEMKKGIESGEIISIESN